MGLFSGDSTSSNTNNNYDQRQVSTTTTDSHNTDLSDNRISNWADSSTKTSNTSTSWDLSDNSTKTTNSSASYDLSDRSTKTTNTDLSDRSTKNTTTNADLSDHSVDNSWSIVTDGGAIGSMAGVSALAVSGANAQALGAYAYADHIFDGAMTFANSTVGMASDAFSQAALMSRDTLTQAQSIYQGASQSINAANMAAMNAQQKATDQIASAYADAKGTTASQKQIVMGVLAVAGLFVLSTMYRKG
jgi:hypothetical protein